MGFKIILLIFYCIIVVILIYIYHIFSKNKIDFMTAFDHELRNKKNELLQYQELLNNQKEKINNTNNDLLLLEKQIKDKENFNSTLLKIRENELDNIIKTKETIAYEELQKNIDEWSKSAQEAAEFAYISKKDEYDLKIVSLENTLIDLISQIDDYQEKINIINNEITRARQLEENQNFYKVQLDDKYKQDILILNEIRNKISKIDILDKLIYDNYVKKSVDDMIKRVLNGRAPSGIYKITRLSTGEIYIGKSVDIKARWQQHCKSCYHCGTISHSNLHTTMEKDGIWNFTFELLEEAPKDKLTEREKFWIGFYDSKKYGLNEREG